MKISDLQGKKILILGFQEEGLDNLLFFQENIDYALLGIADQKNDEEVDSEIKKQIKGDVVLHFGEDYLSSVDNYDVIVKTPGIPFHLINKNNNQIITSQSDIFLNNCKGKIIGITGTKGKTTTCQLLYETLKVAGVDTFLIGNVGKPAMSMLPGSKEEDVFIYELSSFQLQTVTKSPEIAVFLNLYRDHLDKHLDFREYLESKRNITRFQKETDFFIYNKENEDIVRVASDSRAIKIPFIFEDFSSPVLKILEVLKIDSDFLKEAISKFKSPRHRMEYVGRFNEINFFNDSASTIPEATIKAINDTPDIQTIIIGGSEKGSDVSSMILAINNNGGIKNVVILKKDKGVEIDGIDGTKKIFFAPDMESAVKVCFKETEPDHSCVLSPGFASFNMFKSYKERGDLFCELVKNYK